MKSTERTTSIIGLGCRVAGSPDVPALLDNLQRVARCFTEVDELRWSSRAHASELPPGFDLSTPLAAVVNDCAIDWRALRLPPLQVERMHRMERIALAAMSAALVDADVTVDGPPLERARIFVASTTLGRDPLTDHSRRIRRFELQAPLSAALQTHLPDRVEEIDEILEGMFQLAAPPIEPDSLTTSASVIAGRIANIFDLWGGHVAIDCGMSSSLAAVDEAHRAILAGTCDLALVCACSPIVGPSTIVGLAHAGLLGTEPPRPFAEPAAGTLPGEGAVAMVLAPSGRRKHRRVYAVVEAVTQARPTRSEGTDLAGAIERAAAAALDEADRDPDQVAWISSCALGIQAADRQELVGLASAYATLARDRPLRVTSTTANFGCLPAAGGLLAMVEAVLGLHAGTGFGQPDGPGTLHAFPGLCVPSEQAPLQPEEAVACSDVAMDGVAFHALLRRPSTNEPVATPIVRRPFEPIAIVGLGVQVPGATDVPTFWHNVLAGAEAIGDLPTRRWSVDRMIGADRHLGDLLKTRLAATVELPKLDPARYRLSAAAWARLDPAVQMALRCCEQALDDAGYQPGRWDPMRMGLVVGQLPVRIVEAQLEMRLLFAGHLSLAAEAMREAGVADGEIEAICRSAREQLDRELPALGSRVPFEQSGFDLVRTVAHAFDIGGPALCVDAACASSLAAVELCANRLHAGELDVAIAAGVAFNLTPEYYLSLSMLGALSPRGTPPFQVGADGFVPGEAAGAVVLKRLDTALGEGDRIYAVVRGLGCSSDGRGVSVFAPNPRGERLAIERGLAVADVPPHHVDYVEAHGTGTKLGDATEIGSYVETYGRGDRATPLTISTVKSQIGHSSSAAGLIGLVKATLAVHERILPPGLGDEQPNPELPFASAPVELGLVARTWARPTRAPRMAGVSAFGLGGVNYHLILEEHRSEQSEARLPPASIPAAGTWAHRFAVELVPLALNPGPPRCRLAGGPIVVLGGPAELSAAFTRALTARGASPHRIDVQAPEALEAAVQAEFDRGALGIVDLSAFGPKPAERWRDRLPEDVERTFGALRGAYGHFAAAEPHRRFYAAVTSLGGDLGLMGSDVGNLRGAYLGGVAKALKQELPDLQSKIIDFDPLEDVELVATRVIEELEDANDRMEVGYAGRRFAVNLRLVDHAPDAAVFDRFEPGDVFLFSGGGRGVVFECALALARRGVRVVVTGRTDPPDPSSAFIDFDDQRFAKFRQDELERRRKLDPRLTPVAFAKAFSRFERARELHRNLERARAAGVDLRYEPCDIADLESVRELVAKVVRELGPIRGVVHGAMVEWSRSLPSKTADMLLQTTEVKVLGLEHLLEVVDPKPLRVFACFGSGAGRFGNRGQTDYSGANAMMAAQLAAAARSRLSDVHCVTIDWTAWKDVGAAVANDDIAARVRETGVTAISTEEGVYWFLSELQMGRVGEVVIFDEAMLRRWPNLGSQPERREQRIDFDDRGLPLVPGDWPMVDVLLHRDERSVKFLRRLDLDVDPFLSQHQLHGAPILPATFGCELLAEAAALTSPGWFLVSAKDIQIDVPAKLHRGEPLTLIGQARIVEETDEMRIVEAETRSNLVLHGKTLQRERLHHRGRFVFRRAPTEVRTVTIPRGEVPVRARSIFVNSQEPVRLGPIFFRAAWIQLRGDTVVGSIRAPRQRGVLRTTSCPEFLVDPLVMDTAFQIAANWDGYRNGFVSVPMGIGGVTLGRPRKRSEATTAIATVRRIVDPDVWYDLAVVGDDDEVVMDVQDLRLRRVGAVESERP